MRNIQPPLPVPPSPLPETRPSPRGQSHTIAYCVDCFWRAGSSLLLPFLNTEHPLASIRRHGTLRTLCFPQGLKNPATEEVAFDTSPFLAQVPADPLGAGLNLHQ